MCAHKGLYLEFLEDQLVDGQSSKAGDKSHLGLTASADSAASWSVVTGDH